MTEETKQLQGRLQRRDRRVRDAVLLIGHGAQLRALSEATPACLADVAGTPLIVRFLRQLSGRGIERAYLVSQVPAAVLERGLADVEGLPEIHIVEQQPGQDLNSATTLGLALDEMARDGGARAFLLADGDILLGDDGLIAELLTDPRPNVLAVELELAHNLRREGIKVQMEPVDVPWYTRRVVGLAEDLDPMLCHGEPIGVQVIGGSSFDAIRDRIADLEAAATYPEAFAALMEQDHEFYTVAVVPRSFVKVDTADDLVVARRLA